MPPISVQDIPVSDLDLFTDDARLRPYPLYAQLRALGPVVYLSRHDVYALSRYEQVRDVLGNWERYSSAQGVTMNPQMNEQLKGIITLFLDPPEHTSVRKALGRPLRADRLRELAPKIEAEAESIVEELGRARVHRHAAGPAGDERALAGTEQASQPV
jgi:cytochrome P450